MVGVDCCLGAGEGVEARGVLSNAAPFGLTLFEFVRKSPETPDAADRREFEFVAGADRFTKLD